MQWNKSKSFSLSEDYTLVASQLFLLTMHPGSNLNLCTTYMLQWNVGIEQMTFWPLLDSSTQLSYHRFPSLSHTHLLNNK